MTTDTYSGLKAMLLVGSLGISLIGMRFLAEHDAYLSRWQNDNEPPQAVTNTDDGSHHDNLPAIPTAVPPYAHRAEDPTPVGNSAAGTSGGGGGGSRSSGGGNNPPAMPTVVGVGALPPIGGGGGNGGGGGGGGNRGGGGGGGGSSQSS